MQAGIYLRSILLASAIALLPSCVAGGLTQFGGNGCRTVYVLTNSGVQPVNSCGGVPREGLTARKIAPMGGDVAGLPELLAAPKFEPDGYYAGVDAPEDKSPLTTIINDAVRDVIAMPAPRDQIPVRLRLQQAVQQLRDFVTEDREHGYMYLVLAWRAAGFQTESGLFPVPDEQVIGVF
jgi:hypothetical protein